MLCAGDFFEPFARALSQMLEKMAFKIENRLFLSFLMKKRPFEIASGLLAVAEGQYKSCRKL